MKSLETELAHLLALLEPPYAQGWRTYCEKKAEGLARKYPQEYGALPDLLKAAMQGPGSSASTP